MRWLSDDPSLDPGPQGVNIQPYVGQQNWNECDWHGVWVTDITMKGSYGRIAYRSMAEGIEVEPQEHFWVRWIVYAKGDKRDSAALHDVRSLKLLPVEPEGWFDDSTTDDTNSITSDREP